MKRQVRDSGSKPDCASDFELHLAVAVGEEREHEERQPVRRRLVERAEHARRIRAAGAAAQQLVGLLAAVAAEILVQDVDHRPEVTALLDVDLEQVAHVVERGRGLAEMALLLDRGRLGVALDHHQAAQHGAVFARHLLPRRLAEMLAERDRPVLFHGREQDAPAVFRHLHVVELGPALGIDRDRGAQIHHRLLEALGAHVLPPVEIAGVPALQRFQHAAVLGEIHVVRNLLAVVDVDEVHGVLPVLSCRCTAHLIRHPEVPGEAGPRRATARMYCSAVSGRPSFEARCARTSG